MELKELGKTGVMVPEIGLGTWDYSGGTEPLRRGVELGAFFIDTAENYLNEDAVGQAIRGIRDQVFIATKVSYDHLSYDSVMRAAETSLEKLGVDKIDLYQIHFPNPAIPITETMRAMESLVDSGQVSYIGVSNFSAEELCEAQAVMNNNPIVSNQVLYNLRRREIERDLLPYCQENGVTVIAYTPLDNGSLATTRRSQRNGGLRELSQIGSEIYRTPAQVALNWCVSRPGVVTIPKSDSVARTEENCAASGWRLSEKHIQALERTFASARSRGGSSSHGAA